MIYVKCLVSKQAFIIYAICFLNRLVKVKKFMKQINLLFVELDLQAEKDRLSQMLEIHKSQDLSLSDIERLKAEQEGLKQQVEQLEKQIANIDMNIWNLSMEQAKLNEKVMSF